MEGNSLISQGLLNEKYWAGQAIADKDEPMIAYASLAKRFSFETFDRTFFVESRSVASLTTTHNSMVLFSQVDAASFLAPDKSIGLYGNILSYSYNAIGMNLEGATSNQNWAWKVTPKLLKITSFKSDTGFGTFSKFGESQKLVAETTSIGYWEYGFFENGTKPVDYGNGITADLQVRFLWDKLSIQASAENLYSRLVNYGLFYNSKKYQTESKNSIIISNTSPAMSGEYGQANFISSLPIFSQLKLEYEFPSHYLKISTGIDTLDSTSRAWGAFTISKNDFSTNFKSYGFRNSTLMIQVTDFGIRGLAAGIGVESDLRGQWQFNSAKLSYNFRTCGGALTPAPLYMCTFLLLSLPVASTCKIA